MAENSVYFDSILADRAMLLDPNDYQGDHTASLETQSDIVTLDIPSYIHDNFREFFKIVKYLSPEDQELLLGYYLLSKTQWSLALVQNSTQTLCSFKLRLAIKKIGTHMLLGVPAPEKMDTILAKIGREFYNDSVKMSEIIELYSKTRSFKAVASAYKIKRPEVRRVISGVAKELLGQKEAHLLALGAYIFGLVDKASAQGKGLSARERAKLCPIYRRDPDILGKFRVDVTDKNFEHLLVTKANH